MPTTVSWRRTLERALSLCLFLVVLGANWAVALRFGSDIPDMDQWDAEGAHLLAPWFEQGPSSEPLLRPHNEHRVILTKLQTLGLVAGGGHWDSRVECAVNALLHAAIAVGLWAFARAHLRGALAAAAYILIGLIYALPLAWQNLLGGFHSQQYWLAGLSLLTIGWLGSERAGSARWWGGALAAILSLASMGSGFFGSALVLVVLAWRLADGETTWRGVWPTWVLCAGLVAVGFTTRLEVDYHESLKARTASDFLLYLGRSLEWPFRGQPWGAAVLWLPWVVLLGAQVRETARRRHRAAANPIDGGRAARVTVAMGGWVLLQLLATAYTRGAGAPYPASRYMDTLMVGAIANGLACGLLLSRRPPSMPARWTLRALAVAWSFALGAGLFALSRTNLADELPRVRSYYIAAETHLRAYLATDDPAQLRDPLPYLHAEGLMDRLAHPALRARMPSSVRPALRLEPAGPASAFARNEVQPTSGEPAPRSGLSAGTRPLPSRPTWGSYSVEVGARAVGEWRSLPVAPPAAGWLRFDVVGDIGTAGTHLYMLDAATGRTLAEIRPSKHPGESWRTAYARTPAQPFVVAAADTSPDGWLAFSAPVEMTNLSYWTWRVMRHGVLLVIIAGSVAVVLGAALFVTGLKSGDRR